MMKTEIREWLINAIFEAIGKNENSQISKSLLGISSVHRSNFANIDLNLFIGRDDVEDLIDLIYKFRLLNEIELLESLEQKDGNNFDSIKENLFVIEPFIQKYSETIYSLTIFELWIKNKVFIDSYTDEASIVKMFDILNWVMKTISNSLNLESITSEKLQYEKVVENLKRENEEEKINSKISVKKALSEFEFIISILEFVEDEKVLNMLKKASKIFEKKFNTLNLKIEALQSYFDIENESGVRFFSKLSKVNNLELDDLIDDFPSMKNFRNFICHPNSFLKLLLKDDNESNDILSQFSIYVDHIEVSLFLNNELKSGNKLLNEIFKNIRESIFNKKFLN